MPLQPGDAAPDFSLPATGGGTISLAKLKGRKAVLYFYPKDDTSGCTLEAQNFNALRGEFQAAETELIGVSPDSLKSHDKFRSKYGLDLTLAADEGKDMLQAYGVWAEKSMYGIHGGRAHDDADRPRRQDREDVVQGERARPRRGGAGSREGALSRARPRPAFPVP
jgi:thioredoxin-dependent peroxiredoxin